MRENFVLRILSFLIEFSSISDLSLSFYCVFHHMLSRASDFEVRTTFDIFDADQSGRIDSDEFLFALRALGWASCSEKDVQEVFSSIGKTHVKGGRMISDMGGGTQSFETSSLTYEEFATVIKQYQRPLSSTEEAHAAFKLFDRAGRKHVTKDDLRAIGESVTGSRIPDDLVDDILRIGDKDRDGVLSFEEFFNLVSKGSRSPARERSADRAPDASSSAGAKDSNATAAPKPPAEEVIAGVKVTFDTAGRISKTAVREALRLIGYDDDTLTEKDFNDLFVDTDSDHDGFLSRHEYCTLLAGFGETVDGY